MLVKKWEELPIFLQCDEVKKYHENLRKRNFHLCLKRMFDMICAICLLILLSPIFLILMIWIRIDSKGTVFFRQERVTQYGRVFRIFKFRTMIQDAEKIGSLVTVENDNRITHVGEMIRKYRLDELPQLINVLLGDMTFVGTRPEVKKYVDCYTNEMKATLLLPAGITSLASIQYKDEDFILTNAKKENDTVDTIYINTILPDKMKYNLISLHRVGVLSDVKVCIKTLFDILH